VVLQDLVKFYQDPAFLAYHVAFFLWLLLVVHWMRLTPNHQSSMLQSLAWGVSGGSVTVTGLQHSVKDWLTLVHAMVRSGIRNDRLVDTHDDHDVDVNIDDIDCNTVLWCSALFVLSILAQHSFS
jgi:hypothetical protein